MRSDMTKNELINIRAALDKASNWAHSQKDLFQMCDAKKLIEEELNRPSLPEGLDEAADECIENLIPQEIHTTTPFAAEYVVKLLDKAFKSGAEFSAPRWISVEESLPPFDEEVIVLTNEMHGNTLSSACHLCFGHRPNPEGWTGRSIFTGEVHHLEPNLHDGWNIPGVRYWMHCPKLPEDSL